MMNTQKIETKNMLFEYMKGNYNDCEIEEMTLFIDGILPTEENENTAFKQQSEVKQ